MTRKHRPQIAGGLYHVTMRGNNRAEIFRADADRERFLDIVGRAKRAHGWQVHSYCLMTNHYHLLLETPEPNIAAGMQWLNSTYAHWFNQINGRIGHMFQRRYADGLIGGDGHLKTVLRYIPLNPVKAGLCKHPQDWTWSSYAATIGLAPRPPFLSVRWLLSKFHAERDVARRRFTEWVEAGMDEERPAHPAATLGEIFQAFRPVNPDSVRRARTEGYSIAEIAHHLGVSHMTIRRWLATEP